MTLRRPGFFAFTDRPSPFPGASAVKIGRRPDFLQVFADRLGNGRADPVGNTFPLDGHVDTLNAYPDIAGKPGLGNAFANHLDPDFIGRHVGYFT